MAFSRVCAIPQSLCGRLVERYREPRDDEPGRYDVDDPDVSRFGVAKRRVESRTRYVCSCGDGGRDRDCILYTDCDIAAGRRDEWHDDSSDDRKRDDIDKRDDVDFAHITYERMEIDRMGS